MSELEITAGELTREYLVDRGLLKAGGRRELVRKMALLRDQDRVAYVLLLARGEALEPWRALWSEMNLDSARHLLLLFNGQRWEARGWDLEPGVISRKLGEAEPELRVYFARGLVDALDLLADASAPSTAESAEEDLPIWLPATAGGLAVTGAVAWVLRRRMQLQRQGMASFQEALASARRTFAEVVIDSDDVALEDSEEAQRIQLRAAELDRELESLERDVARHPEKCGQALTLGRVQHLHDELRVLASTVLQRRS